MSTFKPSKYQKAIFNWIKNDSGNAIIQAVAGSGKTTTIISASKLVPKDKKSIFVAFNKAIANELKKRLPSNVEARTLHSFGYGLFYSNSNIKITLDNNKLFMIIKAVLTDKGYVEESVDFKERLLFMLKLIPLLKAFAVDYTNYDEISEVMATKGFEEDLDDKGQDLIKEILDRCKNNIKTIDYDDMIWIPVINNFKSKEYDWVFVDETQDLNKVQFELIKKMCNGNTRIVGVGDKYQSIYAFRGADSNSMNNFKEYFKAKELPLSICYRCPKTHVNMAKTIVSEIEPFKDAKEGIIETLSLSNATNKMETEDLVLCRTNAPLVKVAFRLIREDKKAVIRGRDIGKGILNLINRYKVVNIEDLEIKVNNFRELQENKLRLIEEGKYDKRKRNSLLSIIDTCDTVLVLIDNVETITELKQKVSTIFSDDIEGIVCSSIHKAKGLEANKIFIINYELMPHPMAKTDEELEQERNIEYVALTRSKSELYIIEGVI